MSALFVYGHRKNQFDPQCSNELGKVKKLKLVVKIDVNEIFSTDVVKRKMMFSHLLKFSS